MYTPVKLDKTRNVLIGFAAMQLFKKLTGKSMTKLDYENEDFEDFVPTIFYCGLVHEDKQLTEEKVIELLDEHIGIAKSIELVKEIMNGAFGVEEQPKNVKGAKK